MRFLRCLSTERKCCCWEPRVYSRNIFLYFSHTSAALKRRKWGHTRKSSSHTSTHGQPWTKEVYSHCLPPLHPTLSIHCSNHSLETSQQTSLPMIDSMLNNFPDECWLQVFAAVNTYTTALHSKRDPINNMMPFWGGKSALAFVPTFSGSEI